MSENRGFAIVESDTEKNRAATNGTYNRDARVEATALEHRDEVWKNERKDIDAMAASLHFE
jgi:hypothetical protein